MCVVSMVGDHYNDKWKEYPWLQPYVQPHSFPPQPEVKPLDFSGFFNGISREEFEALKKDVQEMKKLLERAVEYDKKNNEPNCEMEEKVALLKQVAKMVGVDLSEIFGK